MLIGNRPVTGNGFPQAWEVNSVDRPEVHEAALVDEFQGLGWSRNRFNGMQAKSPGAMRCESFEVNEGHKIIHKMTVAFEAIVTSQAIVFQSPYIRKQTYNF